MSNKRTAAIGVDIGGTKIQAGVVTEDGQVVDTCTLPTHTAGRTVMDQVLAVLEHVMRQNHAQHPEVDLCGIGVGSAGQIDFRTGTVHYANDLIPGYTGTPIKALIRERYPHLPVYIDNDVNVLALAEKRIGVGRSCRDLVCLALGTGVGGAILVNGELVRGRHGAAGELGHISVDFKGPLCMCGNYGCLELYASGTGIARRYCDYLAEAGRPPAKSGIDARAVVER